MPRLLLIPLAAAASVALSVPHRTAPNGGRAGELGPDGLAASAGFERGSSPLDELAASAFQRLPVGSVTPEGWLLEQLVLQRDGLSAHLSQFWPDIASSIWINGSADGGLHERVPYWLNGVVPLAFLLSRAGVDGLPGRAEGVYFNTTDNDTPSMMEQVEQYISYILDHQNHANGWLGPDAGNKTNGNDYWARSNVLQALYQYAEGVTTLNKPINGRSPTDRADEATAAILSYLLEQQRRMDDVTPLDGWSSARWADTAQTVEWLLDHAPGDVSNHTDELLRLIQTLHFQGYDWEGWFDTFNGTDTMLTHNVNNAQALKSAAIYWRLSRNATLPKLSTQRMRNLDTRYGLPTGMFNGDEMLPNPPTRSPSRGIELCGVVEAMWSYSVMVEVHGNAAFADRCERIAYNALPATWASPRGGDMWAHQYLQAVNEINAIKADPHVWDHDGDMAETYGLEPNFGCCTANFHQGWPKFANSLVFTTPSADIVVAQYAPATVDMPTGETVQIQGNYPFDDVVHVVVTHATTQSSVAVQLRIPPWATHATVNGQPVANGTFHVETVVGSTGQKSTLVVDFAPEVRLETWDQGATSVHRGALMYSLPISAKYTTYAHHYGTPDQSSDYYLVPTSDWQVALDLRTSPLTYEKRGYVSGAAPFNHSNWPTVIHANVRHLEFPAWATTVNSADPPPSSPACTGPNAGCGQAYSVDLVPHGGTDLRIGELPLSGL